MATTRFGTKATIAEKPAKVYAPESAGDGIKRGPYVYASRPIFFTAKPCQRGPTVALLSKKDNQIGFIGKLRCKQWGCPDCINLRRQIAASIIHCGLGSPQRVRSNSIEEDISSYKNLNVPPPLPCRHLLGSRLGTTKKPQAVETVSSSLCFAPLR